MVGEMSFLFVGGEVIIIGKANQTMLWYGNTPTFNNFIGNLSPKHRELFHFPLVGHSYYTEQTQKVLDRKYFGWDKTGEYSRSLDRL